MIPENAKFTKEGFEFSLDNLDKKKIKSYGFYSIMRYGFRMYPYFERRKGWFFRQTLIYCVVRLDVYDLETDQAFACIAWYPIITSPIWFLRKKDKYVQEAVEWALGKLEQIIYERYTIYVYPEELEEEFSGNFRVEKITFCGAYMYETERLSKEEKARAEFELREAGFPEIQRVI